MASSECASVGEKCRLYRVCFQSGLYGIVTPPRDHGGTISKYTEVEELEPARIGPLRLLS